MKTTNNRRLRLLLLTCALLLASLACRTLLGDPNAGGGPSPTDSSPPTAAPSQAEPSPTSSASKQPDLTERLNGQNLPDLDFGAPGRSPADGSRPDLSGSPRTLDTEHFRIHYSDSGQDAVPAQDDDGNGHPDYVEHVARALEYSWAAEVDHFGWAPPPPDEGLGGDDRFDVYLADIFDEGNAGYVEGDFDVGFFGDNPLTSVVETRASSSYMALDNDYDGYNDSPVAGVSLLDYMRSTAAHEFSHSIQYGYDGDEPHDWLWEATATWIQDEVFDLVNDGNEALPAVFKSPDSCQLAYGGENRVEDSDHWYGMWIFLRYVSENYGHAAIREVWEATVDLDGYDAWDQALAGYDTDLESVFQDFAVALLLRNFDEGENYPVVRLEASIGFEENFQPLDGVGQLGLDYLGLEARDLLGITLTGDGISGLAVGVLDGQAHVFALAGGQAAIDTTQFDSSYLLVLNLDRAARERNCRSADYSITVVPVDQPDSAIQQLASPNFRVPRVEGLRQWDE
jgi:hypothetical protein